MKSGARVMVVSLLAHGSIIRQVTTSAGLRVTRVHLDTGDEMYVFGDDLLQSILPVPVTDLPSEHQPR